MAGLLTFLLIALAVLIALLTVMLVHEMRHPPRHGTAYALAKGLPCDPGDLGLRFGEWWLERPDGSRLPVWEVATSPESAGETKTAANDPRSLTAVFLHGWGHSRVDVLPRLHAFLPFCSNVVLYDLRGHGEATGKSNLGDGEQHDLLALLDRLGDRQFVLVGHSMGAVIAIKAAIEAAKAPEHSHRIVGIVAYGPYCEFHTSLQGRLRVAGYPRWPITSLAMIVQQLRGLRPLNLHERELKALHCPMLLVHGCNDMVSPISHGRRLAKSAANITLQEVPDAGHVDAHLINAVFHRSMIADFFRQIAATPARAAVEVPVSLHHSL